jgi:succinate dehydrogenase hydrophobic anchor subunit
MNTNTAILISAYLLARATAVILMLAIVFLVACPLIWSRDPGRRARSREALRMLITLLTIRQIK